MLGDAFSLLLDAWHGAPARAFFVCLLPHARTPGARLPFPPYYYGKCLVRNRFGEGTNREQGIGELRLSAPRWPAGRAGVPLVIGPCGSTPRSRCAQQRKDDDGHEPTPRATKPHCRLGACQPTHTDAAKHWRELVS